jgi:RNA polymerase sigma-70 factor (ECF subfamily)
MVLSTNRDTLHNTSAEELIVQARDGSSACFDELVERYSGRLYHFLLRKTASAEDAEDLVQETFIKAYQNLHRYKPVYQFSTWLFTIGVRLYISHYRKARKNRAGRLEPDVKDETPSPVEVVMKREERDKLWRQARALPSDQYDALWLRYVEELPIKEIALVMQKTGVHVKVLLYRARQNMVTILDNRAK